MGGVRRLAARVGLVAGSIGDRRGRQRAQCPGRLQGQQLRRQNPSERSAANDKHVDRAAFGLFERVVDPTAGVILGEGGDRQRHCDVSRSSHASLPCSNAFTAPALGRVTSTAGCTGNDLRVRECLSETTSAGSIPGTSNASRTTRGGLQCAKACSDCAGLSPDLSARRAAACPFQERRLKPTGIVPPRAQGAIVTKYDLWL